MVEYPEGQINLQGYTEKKPGCEPITKQNLARVTAFFTKIVAWICRGLTIKRFKALKQTSSTIPLFADCLLHDVELDYALPEKFQSYFFEKRFDRYRQLSGANYSATERQFFEAEKSIRVKPMIKFSECSIKNVQSIIKKDDGQEKAGLATHFESIMDMVSEDVPVIRTVTAFTVKRLTKNTKSPDCFNILSNRSKENSIVIEEVLPNEC